MPRFIYLFVGLCLLAACGGKELPKPQPLPDTTQQSVVDTSPIIQQPSQRSLYERVQYMSGNWDLRKMIANQRPSQHFPDTLVFRGDYNYLELTSVPDQNLRTTISGTWELGLQDDTTGVLKMHPHLRRRFLGPAMVDEERDNENLAVQFMTIIQTDSNHFRVLMDIDTIEHIMYYHRIEDLY